MYLHQDAHRKLNVWSNSRILQPTCLDLETVAVFYQLDTSRTVQTSEVVSHILYMVNHVVGTAKPLEIRSLEDSPFDLRRVKISVLLFLFCCKAVAYTNKVISWLGCVPPTHLDHQDNFPVSSVFAPTVLRDTVNKLFQCLEVLLMNRHLCYMIWSDNTSSWSNLNQKKKINFLL